MDFYSVIMTPDAIDDITELRNYIADVLGAPDTALGYLRAVRREIDTLSVMPARYKTMAEEPWHSRGVRRLPVKNSFIYYRIDDTAGKVFILNVIYARRDQLKALARQ